MTVEEMTVEELVARTRQILAAKAVLRFSEPIRLASGQMSDVFVDGKAGLAEAGDLRVACAAIHALLVQAGIDYDAVGGLTLGADHLAVGTALAGDKRWLFVRKEPKDRGTAKQIEGAVLGADDRVVVVEDVVSTGTSMLKAIEVVQAAGARVVAACTLIDRGGHVGASLEARGIRYLPVASHTDLGLAPVAAAS